MYFRISRPPGVVARPLVKERPPVVSRPFIERPFMERPFMDRPFMERPFMERPFMDRPFMERPFMDRPFMDRPFSDWTASSVDSPASGPISAQEAANSVVRIREEERGRLARLVSMTTCFAAGVPAAGARIPRPSRMRNCAICSNWEKSPFLELGNRRCRCRGDERVTGRQHRRLDGQGGR